MNIRSLSQSLFVSLLLLVTIPPVVHGQSAAQKTVSTTFGVNNQDESRTERFIRTELFFGQSKADGTEVSEEDFAAFLNKVVTPEFPDGLTVLSGIGQFRASDGQVIQEKSKILILLRPFDTRKDSSRKIERIREAYKTEFQQQSVLRADDPLPIRISF